MKDRRTVSALSLFALSCSIQSPSAQKLPHGHELLRGHAFGKDVSFSLQKGVNLDEFNSGPFTDVRFEEEMFDRTSDTRDLDHPGDSSPAKLARTHGSKSKREAG
jgi:hypothetical protein